MAKMVVKTITKAGYSLIAKNMAGKPLVFTRIMAGSGLLLQAQDPKKLTGLIDEKISLENPEIMDNGNNTVIAQKSFSSDDLEVGFLFTELGLAAIDPDTGLEVLFCYNNTGTAQNADYISPSEGSEVIEKVLRMITAVGDMENVNVTIDSSAYVSMDLFENHIQHPEQHPYFNELMPEVENIKEALDELSTSKSDIQESMDWQEMHLGENFIEHKNPLYRLKYCKDNNGFVVINGLCNRINGDIKTGDVIGILPEGYRPLYNHVVSLTQTSGWCGFAAIHVNGEIYVHGNITLEHYDTSGICIDTRYFV